MIRAARPGDVPVIYRLIRELAGTRSRWPRSPPRRRTCAGPCSAPAARCSRTSREDDGAVVGFALWFLNYSTWTGTHGIYLEDLFVEPGVRGHGHGKALLAELAWICVERGYERLEWAVLDWNTPSIAFYRSIGARAMDEWEIYRLSGPALAALGSADETRTRQ